MGKKPWRLISVLLFMMTCTSVQAVDAGRTYRWVDDDGVVHFGDHIPPEFSKTDRYVLNEQGVTVNILPHEKSASELEQEARIEALSAAKQRRADEQFQRDTILLTTYLSVDDIEALRNRRKDLLDGQIRVTEIYLTNLREKLEKLQVDAARFQPYNPDPNAPPIHDWLAKELSNTLNSILVYEKTLGDTRIQKNEIVAKFDKDIGRFRSLKGLN